MSRDRVEFKVSIDVDVQAVLGFIQDRVPLSRRIGVVERLPQLAMLLWGGFAQEPVSATVVELPKSGPSQSIASGYSPVQECVGDGSEAVKNDR